MFNKIYKNLILVCFFILPVLFSACFMPGDEDKVKGPNELSWTIMYYVDADNNLEEALMHDLNEIESVNFAGQNVKVIALVDRISGYTSIDDGWSDTRAFEIGYDSDGYDEELSKSTKRIAIPGLNITTSSEIEINMGDPDTLSTFISFCKTEYPADNYMLLFTNHGNGWRSEENPVNLPYKELCNDDTDNDVLYMSEVRQGISAALSSGEKLDIVGIDACLMGMVEVAYELKDVADILVASPELVHAFGYPYTAIFNKVKNFDGDLTPVSLATIFVEEFSEAYTEGNAVDNVIEGQAYLSTDPDHTLSAIDLSKITAVKDAIDSLAVDLSGGVIATIKQTIYNSESFDNYDSIRNSYFHIDIYDFCSNLNGYDVKKAAVIAAINDAVIANEAGTNHPNSHGLAIYVPKLLNDSTYACTFDSDYNGTNISFAADAPNWQSFVDSLD